MLNTDLYLVRGTEFHDNDIGEPDIFGKFKVWSFGLKLIH